MIYYLIVIVASILVLTPAIRVGENNTLDLAQQGGPGGLTGGSLASESEQNPIIKLFHWNILSAQYGDNGSPWLLYPLQLTDELRKELDVKYRVTTLKPDGKKMWPNNIRNGFDGLLSEEQVAQVLGVQAADFDWEARAPKMMNEIIKSQADIISLVELDKYDEVRDQLEGYDSQFAKRPGRSKDGNGIFWRKEHFEQVGEKKTNNFIDWEHGDDPEQAPDRTRRAYLAVALRDLRDGSVFVVVSMHLLKSPEQLAQSPKRMLQVVQLMNDIQCFARRVGARGLVIMGDFNAMPGSFSVILMQEGWQDCKGNEKQMTDAFHSTHTPAQADVCSSRTLARNVWIDYIFFSGATMEQVGNHVDKCPETPIPNAEVPSDHLPVQSQVRFKQSARTLLDEQCAAPGSVAAA